MARLWINNPETPEGKYLVKRRDGTVPDWPHFVLAASDPAAPAALRAYADAGEKAGFDPAFVSDLRELADRFEAWRLDHRAGDPDAPRHRTDDPATVAEMRVKLPPFDGTYPVPAGRTARAGCENVPNDPANSKNA